tara:strand:- start:1345 stop:1578 length:234 start_codon:yes stop_codon:yes gene_type:complete
MLDVAFTVISETEDGSDITPEQIHLAIERRLVTLREVGQYEIGGAIGHCDTYRDESHPFYSFDHPQVEEQNDDTSNF